jgi:maleamate amidohydrolase
MPTWDDLLTERDRQVGRHSGYGRMAGLGRRPAVLVIDVNVAFCGDRPEPILESIKRWRNSCGLEAWAAGEKIATLLDAARAKRVPVIYTTALDTRPDGFGTGRSPARNARRTEDLETEPEGGNEIHPPIAPKPQDLIIRKTRPSAFFGTPLVTHLIDLQVDTLLVTGTTTSGCVRASVVDAFSYDYHLAVIEDCVFDRTEASHAINLFDMQQKYADVIDLDAGLRYLEDIPAGLYDERMPGLRVKAAV